MAPLEYNQRSLEFFGFLSINQQNIRSVIVRFIILGVFVVMALVPSSYYLYLHVDDTETIISALTPIVAYLLVSASYVTFVSENKTAINNILELRALAEEREYISQSQFHEIFNEFFTGLQTESKTFYEQAEKYSEFVTKWPLRVLLTNYTSITIILAGWQILADWLNGDMDPSHWELVYKLR